MAAGHEREVVLRGGRTGQFLGAGGLVQRAARRDERRTYRIPATMIRIGAMTLICPMDAASCPAANAGDTDGARHSKILMFSRIRVQYSPFTS